MVDALGDRDLFGNVHLPKAECILKERFIVPPFSLLNAREGDWQERKRRWISLGIKSEAGRDIDPTCVSKNVPEYMAGRGNNEGGSIFDPVLCEILYKWFSPVGGHILDPFAGGSVRGIVASLMGRKYTGIDLREEQIIANRKQAVEICEDSPLMPQWICGDALNVPELAGGLYDFFFTCPPYGDLEVYSEDPLDLSTMDHHAFIGAYSLIIGKCCAMLRTNSFASIVVGDYRGDDGHYKNFTSDTIAAFLASGLKLYNRAILVTMVGSLPIRITRQFEAGRKLGNTHQDVLIFCKGDWRIAADKTKHEPLTK